MYKCLGHDYLIGGTAGKSLLRYGIFVCDFFAVGGVGSIVFFQFYVADVKTDDFVS